MTATLDIAANRRARKWTRREQLGRVLWSLAHPLFACSPRPAWAWRRGLLRLFGAEIGTAVQVHPSVRVTIPWNLTLGDEVGVGDRAILYALGPIRIGAQATVSQGAHLCAGTHDHRDPAMPLVKAPIEIGNGAWICADAFVGPGRRVGARAILAARGVLTRDLAPGGIAGGNPAEVIGQRGGP
ncbi:MAG: acetyltransferase [Pseudomonadota bacterium]